MVIRKWLAGWISRLGGALVALADRIWPPPELRQYYIDHSHHPAARRARSEQLRNRRAASRWN